MYYAQNLEKDGRHWSKGEWREQGAPMTALVRPQSVNATGAAASYLGQVGSLILTIEGQQLAVHGGPHNPRWFVSIVVGYRNLFTSASWRRQESQGHYSMDYSAQQLNKSSPAVGRNDRDDLSTGVMYGPAWVSGDLSWRYSGSRHVGFSSGNRHPCHGVSVPLTECDCQTAEHFDYCGHN
jgi:hypothetical protein